jgi:hypothetical protein
LQKKIRRIAASSNAKALQQFVPRREFASRDRRLRDRSGLRCSIVAQAGEPAA